MKRKGIFTTENTENTEVDSVASVRSVVNTEDLPDNFQMTELGPLPEEWRVVKLGEVLFEVDVRVRDLAPDASHLPVLSLTKNDGLVLQMERFGKRIATDDVSNYKVVRRGQIVNNPYVIWEGAVHILSKYEAGLVSPVYPVWEVKTWVADGWFIDHLLRMPAAITAYNRFAAGAVNRRRAIRKSDFLSIQIPLPPPPEQRAIAHVLRTVQRAKEATEGVIAALKELKKSLMRHLFTYGPVPVGAKNFSPQRESEIGPLPAHWRVVRLGEVALLERGLSWSKDDEESNGIGVLSIPDILTNGRLNSFPRVHLSKQVTSNKLLVKGDILLVGSSGAAKNVGRSGVLREEPASPLAFASFTIRLRGKPDALLQEFASYLILSSWIDFAHFSKRAADGKYNLQLRQLQSAFIPLPPLDEQREIARMLQAVDAKIAAEQARREALEGLFKTLLQELMSGRRRVCFTTENTEDTEK